MGAPPTVRLCCVTDCSGSSASFGALSEGVLSGADFSEDFSLIAGFSFSGGLSCCWAIAAALTVRQNKVTQNLTCLFTFSPLPRAFPVGCSAPKLGKPIQNDRRRSHGLAPERRDHQKPAVIGCRKVAIARN